MSGIIDLSQDDLAMTDDTCDDPRQKVNSIFPGYYHADVLDMLERCMSNDVATIDLIFCALSWVFSSGQSGWVVIHPDFFKTRGPKHFNNPLVGRYDLYEEDLPIRLDSASSFPYSGVIFIVHELDHFSLLVWKPTTPFVVYTLDSLENRIHTFEILQRKLEEFLGTETFGGTYALSGAAMCSGPLFETNSQITLKTMRVPSQPDGLSCGFYCIAMGRLLISRNDAHLSTDYLTRYFMSTDGSYQQRLEVTCHHYVLRTREFLYHILSRAERLHSLLLPQLKLARSQQEKRPEDVRKHMQACTLFPGVSALYVDELLDFERFSPKLQVYVLQRQLAKPWCDFKRRPIRMVYIQTPSAIPGILSQDTVRSGRWIFLLDVVSEHGASSNESIYYIFKMHPFRTAIFTCCRDVMLNDSIRQNLGANQQYDFYNVRHSSAHNFYSVVLLFCVVRYIIGNLNQTNSQEQFDALCSDAVEIIRKTYDPLLYDNQHPNYRKIEANIESIFGGLIKHIAASVLFDCARFEQIQVPCLVSEHENSDSMVVCFNQATLDRECDDLAKLNPQSRMYVLNLSLNSLGFTQQYEIQRIKIVGPNTRKLFYVRISEFEIPEPSVRIVCNIRVEDSGAQHFCYPSVLYLTMAEEVSSASDASRKMVVRKCPVVRRITQHREPEAAVPHCIRETGEVPVRWDLIING